jgi:hypothetical protein
MLGVACPTVSAAPGRVPRRDQRLLVRLFPCLYYAPFSAHLPGTPGAIPRAVGHGGTVVGAMADDSTLNDRSLDNPEVYFIMSILLGCEHRGRAQPLGWSRPTQRSLAVQYKSGGNYAARSEALSRAAENLVRPSWGHSTRCHTSPGFHRPAGKVPGGASPIETTHHGRASLPFRQ